MQLMASTPSLIAHTSPSQLTYVARTSSQLTHGLHTITYNPHLTLTTHPYSPNLITTHPWPLHHHHAVHDHSSTSCSPRLTHGHHMAIPQLPCNSQSSTNSHVAHGHPHLSTSFIPTKFITIHILLSLMPIKLTTTFLIFVSYSTPHTTSSVFSSVGHEVVMIFQVCSEWEVKGRFGTVGY